MSNSSQHSACDVAIVGGGLAGGLIALALHRAHPQLRLALIESGPVIGGNHRWSWFESDLSAEGKALLAPFEQTAWDAGYDVAFPRYTRTLGTGYRSMASEDFHAGLVHMMPADALLLGRRASAIDSAGVDLEGGERIAAGKVIDCRTIARSAHLRGGWQVFHGRHFRLPEAHGIDRPVIMDASVDQLAPHGNGGSYRFVYVLPLSERDVFIEDTYYADDAKMDRAALAGRIDAYAHRHGWAGGVEVGQESGVLPVLTGGDFAAYQDEVRIPGVAIAGARGGFTHPLTSYTLPVAVENALAIATHAHLSGQELADMMERRARSHWRRTGYYRLLARFLFFAADPDARVNVFQRFYRLREGLIERFYAGKSTAFDRLRVLWGNPPVAVSRAIVAMFNRGQPQKPQTQSENTE